MVGSKRNQSGVAFPRSQLNMKNGIVAALWSTSASGLDSYGLGLRCVCSSFDKGRGELLRLRNRNRKVSTTPSYWWARF